MGPLSGSRPEPKPRPRQQNGRTGVGGNILYDRMEIRAAEPGKGIHLTLPLDKEGESRMAQLTTDAFTQPILIAGNPSESRKIAMLLDDRITNLFEVKSPGIRSGVIEVAEPAMPPACADSAGNAGR